MPTALKWLSLAAKGLAVVAGLSAYANYIPEKWLPVAAIAFAVASVLKDSVNRIGDLLDDGKENNSFGK